MRRGSLLTLLLTSLLCGCAAPGEGDGPAASTAELGDSERARIVWVIDGDTVKVRLQAGGRRTVRVLGIDTPESRKPGTPVECGARQADRALRSLAPRGREVVLAFDPHDERVDRYGRLLAYVDAGGGDVGERLVADGWAKVYAYRNRRFERRARYERAARDARRSGRGVHALCGGDFHSAS